MKQEQFEALRKVGNVKFSDGLIIARPVAGGRSEASVKNHGPSSGIYMYRYSFKLDGEFTDGRAIVLQFHDWWNLETNMFSKKRGPYYMATPPPIAFVAGGGRLLLETNSIGTYKFDIDNKYFVPDSNQHEKHLLYNDLDQSAVVNSLLSYIDHYLCV